MATTCGVRECKDCGNTYPLSEEFFYLRRDKDRRPYFRRECKKCFGGQVDARRLRNPEQVKIWRRSHYLNNREIYIQRSKARELKHKNNPAHLAMKSRHSVKHYHKDILKSRARNKISNKARRKKINEWKRERYKNDPVYRTEVFMRNSIRQMLKRNGGDKHNSTCDLFGCSPSTLMRWIESQFRVGMSWENHASDGWHIDHIRPCSMFDLSDLEQQRACFHFTNLQPLWGSENCSKKDTLVYVSDYQI